MKLTLDTPVKFLRSDLSAPISKSKWVVGEWMEPFKGNLIRCKNGYHYTTIRHWYSHCSAKMFIILPGEEVINDGNKSICRTAKLTEEIINWNKRNMRLFAADCAERVVHLTNDPRAVAAIGAIRDYLMGNIDKSQLDVACYCTDNISSYAADAATYATYAASAAYADAVAVYTADASAAYADAVAAYAANAAAYADAVAVYAATLRSEREWQCNRLLQYLNGEI